MNFPSWELIFQINPSPCKWTIIPLTDDILVKSMCTYLHVGGHWEEQFLANHPPCFHDTTSVVAHFLSLLIPSHLYYELGDEVT